MEAVPRDVDTVVFPNYESMPERDDVDDPFTEVRARSTPAYTAHRNELSTQLGNNCLAILRSELGASCQEMTCPRNHMHRIPRSVAVHLPSRPLRTWHIAHPTLVCLPQVGEAYAVGSRTTCC